jgi:hypothetical protein
MRPNRVRTAAKERFSYPLRPRFARWRKRVLTDGSEAVNPMSFLDIYGGAKLESLCNYTEIPGSMLCIAPE